MGVYGINKLQNDIASVDNIILETILTL